jgi:Ni,Fe-hydrogenase III large subunit
MLHQGDVWSRAMLRRKEVEQSIAVIRGLLNEYGSDGDGNGEYANGEYGNDEYANYELSLGSGLLGISLTEGWRGEICHMAITDNSGKIIHYKAKDPSLHNWMALALAVRNQEISDFPLCNKSFNLSYCGNDL